MLVLYRIKEVFKGSMNESFLKKKNFVVVVCFLFAVE